MNILKLNNDMFFNIKSNVGIKSIDSENEKLGFYFYHKLVIYLLYKLIKKIMVNGLFLKSKNIVESVIFILQKYLQKKKSKIKRKRFLIVKKKIYVLNKNIRISKINNNKYNGNISNNIINNIFLVIIYAILKVSPFAYLVEKKVGGRKTLVPFYLSTRRRITMGLYLLLKGTNSKVIKEKKKNNFKNKLVNEIFDICFNESFSLALPLKNDINNKVWQNRKNISYL